MAKQYRTGFVRRVINGLVSILVRRGRGPEGTFILTTMGRRSNQPRSTPVTIMLLGSDRYLVAPYGPVGWVYNVRARPVATLQRGAREQEVALRAVPPEEAAPVLKQYLTQLEGIVGDYFDVSPSDPLETFAAVADQHPVFRIEPA